jgi:hypothetical protein
MDDKAPNEPIDALGELRNSTGKTAQDKVILALADLAWPSAPAPTPTPAPAPPSE